MLTAKLDNPHGYGRIVRDTAGKVTAIDTEDQAMALAGQEALEALTAMGYSITEARDALKMVPAEITDVGGRLRQALKNLAKK